MGLDHQGLAALIGRHMSNGLEQKSAMRWEWDISGGCHAPLYFELFGRPEQWSNPLLSKVDAKMARALIKSGLFAPTHVLPGFRFDPGANHSLLLGMTVRCRRCDWCLAQRAKLWARKAIEEIAAAPRTWFCTFTLSPDNQLRGQYLARSMMAERSVQFDALSADEQFRLMVRAINPEVTRYVKRVRKQSGAPLRYLLVAEKHKTGLPHFHALMHEMDADKPLRKAVLKGQWSLGFSQIKLADKGAAWYLCKYLSKDIATRVRSSLRYGYTTQTILMDSRSKNDVMGRPMAQHDEKGSDATILCNEREGS